MPLDAQPETLARQPQQQRAVARFEQVLNEADALLREGGFGGFSIPSLADRLGYTRASIYKFFPTPYAVLNELARRYLEKLERLLLAEADHVDDLPWRAAVRVFCDVAAGFHERNPVARMLILGGPLTDDGYRAQELSIQRLGKIAQALLAAQGIKLPLGPPDVATLAVEIGTTCFRLSHFEHGRITDEYRVEAARAMIAYLSGYTDDKQPDRKRKRS